MATDPANPPTPTEPRRSSIRLPRPLWIGLAAGLVALGYAGVHWHFCRVGPTFVIGGIKFSLDIERALIRAKFQNKPLLLYFSSFDAEGCRRMEYGALRMAATSGELDKFVCAAVFVDKVPFVDAKTGKEMGDRNSKLWETMLANMWLPAFAVVRPDFDPVDPSDRRKMLAVSMGLADDTGFKRFLDTARAEWDDTLRSEARSRNE